jgi:ATP-binding protein involved in chromosome partitioning
MELNNIVLKYFTNEHIDSVKNFNGKVIVTLKNMEEDPSLANSLKQELLSIKDITKATVIFTKNIDNQPIIPENTKWNLTGVKKIIGVASGKGGVGKSTTAVNLALSLSNLGYKTAIFDADIYGPSLPTMLGFENLPIVSVDGKLYEPFYNFGVKATSIGALIDRNTPLIWRGAKACSTIEQLLTQTNWGEIDIMIIDMPPGTGDIQITLSQKILFDGAIIVSTPQDIALIDAVKGVNMFKKIGVKILGIVENMSYYLCEKCGYRADIFGHDGAKKTAQELGVQFLGEIPLHFDIRENADNGTPIVMAIPNSPHTKAYEEIAKKIIAQLN